MGETLSTVAEAIAHVPHRGVLLCVASVILAVQLAFILAVRRDGSAGSRFAAPAAAALVANPVAVAFAVRTARLQMASGFEAASGSEKAIAVSAGISGQLNAIAFGATTTGMLLALWLIALYVPRSDGQDAPEPRPVPLLPLLILGLLSIGIGTLMWSTQIVKTFATIAGIPPEEKVRILLEAMRLARTSLETFARMSAFTIVGLTVVVGALTFMRRSRPATQNEGRRALVGGALVLVLAGAFTLASRPLRAENDLPWPAIPRQGEVLRVVEPQTPDLEGPDPVERAPVVMVFQNQVALDGYVSSLEELEDKLGTLRMRFELLHPGERFNGSAVLVVGASVSTESLNAALHALHDGFYLRPLLTFTRRESIERPTFGKLERIHSTGARVTLVDAFDVEAAGDPSGGAKGNVLRVRTFPDYDHLAREVVQLRAARNDVVLDLGK